ncbi:ABC transporter permease [Candidatus Berkiella aquae]|uniref:Transport permease protein n=1 Tax=Candidatus Berkiella aquae TaxID=295108 RepID=A0A0Q9YZA4_9GAMM|nr:ABC transporter permease [Candidatus Berkiella aquae]MCS5712443.1 ABC transporter permease [Candidatus Berkiella aquae]
MNPHADFKISFKEMFACLIRNQQIIFQMTKRELLARYRGSILGLAWSFVTPLIMLAVYTFFFSVVFKARWGIEQQNNHAEYAVILFVGLIIHGLFAECINRAPQLIVTNLNFVKKIIFPLEVLPWIALGSALFNAMISFVILLLAQVVLQGNITLTILFVPFIIFPFLLLVMGVSWFLAATGVYLRDISQTTGIMTSILLFVSPVFYSLSMLPENIRIIAQLNPLTLIIDESRKVLLFSEMPNLYALGMYYLVSIVIAWLGFYTFQKTRKGFADVL